MDTYGDAGGYGDASELYGGGEPSILTVDPTTIYEGSTVTITGTDLDQVGDVWLGETVTVANYALQTILTQTATTITFTASFDDGVNPPIVPPVAGYVSVDWDGGAQWDEIFVTFAAGSPPSSGGNRMGGTGAVRKPPR